MVNSSIKENKIGKEHKEYSKEGEGNIWVTTRSSEEGARYVDM